jgi:hypothetical protein
MLSFGQGQDSEAITYRRRHSFDASYPELLFFESRFRLAPATVPSANAKFIRALALGNRQFSSMCSDGSLRG